MTDIDRAASTTDWSVRRFVPRALLLMIVAGIVRHYTVSWNADFAVWTTKALHGLLGRPSPYMFCDESRLYWHATMFVPEVGLILASYWLGWTGRVVRVAAVYLAHTLLTACTISIHESPYLQQNGLVNVATSTLVNANYLLFGVAAWVLVAGPWYRDQGDQRGLIKRVTGHWLLRLMCLCLAVSLVVPLFGLMGTKDAMAARAEMGAAMRDVPWFPFPSNRDDDVAKAEQMTRDRAAAKALATIQTVLQADMAAAKDDASIRSAPIWFLTAHVLASLRPDDAARRQAFKDQAALALMQSHERRRQAMSAKP